MFSSEERCIYQRNPLADVICQLRFPEILAIGANMPVAFQEQIRQLYPQFLVKHENANVPNQPQTVNYHFLSADGSWQLNLTSRFIALTCKKYIRWEDFARQLDEALSAFIQIYAPSYFERIGLRYINFISRKDLELEHISFRELFQTEYLGLMACESIDERSFTCSSNDTDVSIGNGCRAKIHTGPGRVRRNGVDDGEVKYIFDLDLYKQGNIPVNYAASTLETIHAQAFPIFRGAITKVLHEALDPIQP